MSIHLVDPNGDGVLEYDAEGIKKKIDQALLSLECTMKELKIKELTDETIILSEENKELKSRLERGGICQ